MLSERSSNIAQAFPAQVANKCIPGPGSIFSFIALRTTFHVWPRPHFKRSYRPKLTQQSLKWESLKFFLNQTFTLLSRGLVISSVAKVSGMMMKQRPLDVYYEYLATSLHWVINDHSNDEDHEESEQQMTNERHLPKKFFFFGCASGAGEFMMRVGKKWYNWQF